MLEKKQTNNNNHHDHSNSNNNNNNNNNNKNNNNNRCILNQILDPPTPTNPHQKSLDPPLVDAIRQN